MTIDEFKLLDNYIMESLKEKSPFIITTTKLFSIINYDIRLKSGHNALYKEFLEYCEKFEPAYTVQHAYKSEERDSQFDLKFFPENK